MEIDNRVCVSEDEDYFETSCAKCAHNSWTFCSENDDGAGDGDICVNCAICGSVKQRTNCEHFAPKSLFVRFQRWIGIYSYRHKAGFRCYDISRGDFLFFLTVVFGIAFGIGATVGYFGGVRHSTVEYTQVSAPDENHVYYLEKEDRDWLSTEMFKKAVFVLETSNGTFIKRPPYEDQ